jgi:glycosyltransferase involved in cell wall biosynthesis
VPAEDLDSLTAGITKLLRDSGLRTRLGAAARQRVEEEYSAALMTTDYLHVYEEAIEAVKGREHRIESSAASQGNAK